ncbi:Uncharacterised protein [Kluyvera intermedia]|nr:Uncharacterised protein [Kluyvera intermedia]
MKRGMLGVKIGGGCRSVRRKGKQKRTMRVHDAFHNGILLEKCLTLVHQWANASS